MRIGIIGAGAAGLTAAETLRERGYTDITVLEKADCAGGKCCTIQHESCSYELGAGVLSGNNRTALAIAKKYGVETKRVSFAPTLFLDAETGNTLTKKGVIHRLQVAYQALLRYRVLCNEYKRLAEPGFDRIPSELSEPFSTWAKKHDIELLAKEFAPFFTGYGYGFFDEVPAAYVLKYYSWDLIEAFLKRQIYKFPKGIQRLWIRVAQEYNVVYGVNIKEITRNKTVIVKTQTRDFEFDRLIITSPLDEALRFLDATKGEQELFSKIEHYDYRTYACILKDYPKKSGYVPGNYVSGRIGHPVFWYLRHPTTDLYTFYLFGDWKLSDEAAVENIQALLEPLGGKVVKLQTAVHWKFFPHVTPEVMRNGYFDTLEAMQGQKNTYYAGELMNFSTVGLTADYSKHLVERFF